MRTKVSAQSHIPSPSPTPLTMLDTCIQNFSELQHCIVWGKGELTDIFEKVTLF